MKSAEKLAYFFDAADLGSVFAGWPAEIGLALCMDDDGGCEMLLYHRDEGREVMRKVAAVLKRPVGQFAVVPPVEGHPTRRVMFSDEQKLLAMVAAEDDLPEMASDYLINHQWAQERQAKKSRREPPRQEPTPPRWRPRFHLRDVKPKTGKAAGRELPGGYIPAGRARGEECRFAEGQLSVGRRGIRLVIAPELVTARTRAVRVTDVAFRDDFSRFVLPRDVLAKWQLGDPLVIDMAVDLFPAGLQQRFALAPRKADITVTSHGVFVAPGDEVEAPAPDPMPVTPRRRRFLTPVRLAMVALTGIGLMTGSVMRAVDFSDVPLVSQVERGRE